MGIGGFNFKPNYPSQYLSLTPYIGPLEVIARGRKIKITLIKYFLSLKSSFDLEVSV
jgi:hypothetical protein